MFGSKNTSTEILLTGEIVRVLFAADQRTLLHSGLMPWLQAGPVADAPKMKPSGPLLISYQCPWLDTVPRDLARRVEFQELGAWHTGRSDKQRTLILRVAILSVS